MARIAFAWELGTNYGHLSRTLPIAEALRSQGHGVLFAAPDARIAHVQLAPRGFGFVTIPTLPRVSSRYAQSANYGHVLAAAGFLDQGTLQARLHAWVALWRNVDVDVIVIDHAPTALLAARILGKPMLALGAGFTVPPDEDPLPPIRPWEGTTSETLRESDAAVLDSINQALRAFGAPSLGRLADLFIDLPMLVTTFAELDQYGARGNITYIGPTQSDDEGDEAHWQDGDQPHVFAYLRTDMQGFEAALAALKELAADTICVIPDAPDSLLYRLRDHPIRIFSKALQLDPLLRDADVVVNYGGAGIVAQSLQAGVPMLLIPSVIERYLSAQRVAALGAAIVESPSSSVAQLVNHLRALLSEGRYRQAAERFAHQYSTYDPVKASVQAADAITRLARGKARQSSGHRRRVVYAWELGSNAGHIERGLALAEALREHGVDTIFVVQQFELAQRLLLSRGFECISCAAAAPRPPRRPPVNYSDLLLECGFEDAVSLSARAHAWAELFRCVAPELVIVDHAPTAQLAAYACNNPSLLVGSGFSIPPLTNPLPSIQPGKQIPASQLRAADGQLLERINYVLHELKMAPLQHVGALFAQSSQIITTFADLDPYPTRGDAQHVGPLERVTTYDRAQWRTAGVARVFAYLRPFVRDLEKVLAALNVSGMEVICAIPGAPPAILKKYQSPRMQMFDSMIEAPPLLTEADIVVSYGSAGLVAQSLLAGVPLLSVCEALEQVANSLRVVELGAGIALLEDRSQRAVTGALHALAREPRYRLAARRFAEKHQRDRPKARGEIIRAVIRGLGIRSRNGS